MRSQGWMGVVAAVLAGFLCAWGGCRGRPVESGDAAVWDSEPASERRPAGPEAGPEASVQEAGPRDAALEKPEYDDTWCHVQVMPEEDPNAECIPGTGEYENLDWSWDGGRWVAQAEVRNGLPCIVVYDVEDATHFLVGDERKVPETPVVSEGRLLYASFLEDYDSTDWNRQLVEVDLETRTEVGRTWLGDEWALVLRAWRRPYAVLVQGGQGGYGEVRSLETNEATMISDPEQDIQGVWMTDRYVSWTADPAEPSPGYWKDTHYLDLETWEIHRITSWGAQLDTCVDGHRIVWGDTRRSGPLLETHWEGWDVYMYDIETGEERLLSDDPYDQVNPYIHGDLVVWNDYRFTRGRVRDCLNDVYVYDVSSGVGRRVTRVSWWWSVASPVYGGKVLET